MGIENSTFDVGERIYIGKEGRTKVQSVLGKMDYVKISDSAKDEIPTVVESIVTKNEAKICRLHKQRTTSYAKNSRA